MDQAAQPSSHSPAAAAQQPSSRSPAVQKPTSYSPATNSTDDASPKQFPSGLPTCQMKRQQIVFFKNLSRTKLKWNGTEGLLCKRDPDCRSRIFDHHRTPRERRCTHDSPATTEQRTPQESPHNTVTGDTQPQQKITQRVSDLPQNNSTQNADNHKKNPKKLCLEAEQPKTQKKFCLHTRTLTGKLVAKFCSKFLHQQVLKNEAYAAGDIGTSVQKAFFRMDEMIRGQRSWRELAALGDKINKFTGMIEGLIWSPRCGGSNEQPDDWAFEEGPHSDFSGPTCGCTACVVIIRNNQLIVANAGDF